MREKPKMAMLEESNTMRGLAPDDARLDERVVSARRMAAVALAASLLWGFGVLSLLGALAGAGAWAFLRANDPATTYRRVAQAACLLGLVGLVVTAVTVAPSVLGG
jgi:hypothetical protein